MIRRQLRTDQNREQGQSLVEFALTLPVLLFIVFGILDFGRILFTYAQASNALRDALHYAELLGHDPAYAPYLDCAGMDTAARRVFFSDSETVTIQYIKASDTSIVYGCPTDGANLANGDMLRIHVMAQVDPILLPFGPLTLNFEGQRSIVKAIPIVVEITDETGGPTGDPDNDGIVSGSDNCPTVANTSQLDTDFDGLGDPCDNCPNAFNPDQTDTNHNGVGNACETGGGGGLAAPPQPLNFAAVSDPELDGHCTTGLVDFTWTAMSPIPTRMEIRDADTGLVAVDVNDIPNGVVSDAYCYDCDQIDPYVGYQCFYVVAINGIPPNEAESVPSAPSCVDCRWQMPAPTNFVADLNCDTGRVSFDWDWGIAEPLPTRADIRNLTSGQVAVPLTGDMTITESLNSLTVAVPGSYTFDMVAYNGVAPSEVASAPSSSVTVNCPFPPSARVNGYLRHRSNAGNCNAYDTSFTGTVSLARTDGTATYNATWIGNLFEVSGLAAGTYELTVPTYVGTSNYQLVSRDPGCLDVTTSTYTFTLGDGQQLTDLIFGYR